VTSARHYLVSLNYFISTIAATNLNLQCFRFYAALCCWLGNKGLHICESISIFYQILT